jgi:2-oxoglutarate ferredoxin oxidoreductase subunit beta
MTLHMMLAMMRDPLPVAMGVIRDVEAPAYDECVARQISEVQANKPVRKLHDLLMSGEVWEIK